MFTNPGLLRVELAWGFAITAYWAFIIALSVYAYDEGGAAAVGFVGLVRVLPAFVAAPFAGMLGDRYRRERVMFVISTRPGRVSWAATAAALFADSPIWLVYTLAGGVALSASMVRPMQSALLPQLARTTEELTAANLVVTTIESSGIFLGPAIGGLLLAATNAETVFAAAAVAFVLAALLVAGIKVEASAERAPGEASFFREFFAGFGAIGGDRNLRLIIGLYGAQTLIAGALNVLIVVAALELLDLGEAGVGFLNSAVGVGGLFGALAAFALVGRQRLASDFGLGLILWGFPIALVGVFPNPTIALILLGLVGVGNTVVDVAALTLLQRTVPDEVLTRVFGVVQSVFVATLGIGAIVAPLMTGTIGIRWAMVVTGAILPVLAVLLWSRIRALDAEALAPTQNWRSSGRSRSSSRCPRRRSTSSPPTSSRCTLPPAARSSARASPVFASTSSPPARPTWSSTAGRSRRSGRATTSARSPCCATCRERRRSRPGRIPSCTRSTATSS